MAVVVFLILSSGIAAAAVSIATDDSDVDLTEMDETDPEGNITVTSNEVELTKVDSTDSWEVKADVSENNVMTINATVNASDTKYSDSSTGESARFLGPSFANGSILSNSADNPVAYAGAWIRPQDDGANEYYIGLRTNVKSNLTSSGIPEAENRYITLSIDKSEGKAKLWIYNDPSRSTLEEKFNAAINDTTYTKMYAAAAGDTITNTDDNKFDANISNFTSANADIVTGAISGQVVTQDDDPIPNATVNVLQVNKTELNDQGFTSPSDLDSEANRLIEKAEDPLPDDFDKSGLLNTDATPSDLSAKYVAIHRPEDWGNDWWGGFGGVVDLRNPIYKTDKSSAKLVFSIWDPSIEDNLVTAEDDVDADLHGGTVPGSVVIREVDPFNSTSSKIEREVETIGDSGLLGRGQHHRATAVTLNTGIYWVKPKEDGVGYFLKIGDPATEYADKLKDQAGSLANRAQWVRDRLNEDTFELSKVTTNATGHYNFSAPSNVHSVTLQAHKGPWKDLVAYYSKFDNVSDAVSNAEIDDYRTFFDSQLYNGSFYMPSAPKTASPGDSGVDLTLREQTAPWKSNQSKVEDALDRLRDFIDNHSYEKTIAFIEQRLDELEAGEVRDLYEDYYNMLRQNRDAEERANELAEQNKNLQKTLEEYKNQANNTSVDELRDAIEEMEQALAEQSSTVDSGDGSSEIANESLDASRVFDADLTSDNVMAVVQFANGTSATLSPDSEYLTIEESVVGGDTATISDYPVGDSPVVAVQWRAVTEEGVAKAVDRATNPAFGGNIPGLDAVDVSTLAPGPSDRVDLELQPSEGAVFGSLRNLTVYGPDGSAVGTTVDGDRDAHFTTAGAGAHRVEAIYSDGEGQNFTTSFRLLAADVDRSMDPGVRVVESVVGTYALTGDGLDGGRVDVSGGGSTASIEARIPEDGDVPSTLQVYGHGLSLSPQATTNIAIVRGDQGRTVSQNVRVVYHGPALGEDGIAWRHAGGDRQALPSDAGDLGWVEKNATSTTVHTVTGDDGRVGIETNAESGLLERSRHRIDLWLQSVPSLDSVPIFGIAFIFGWPRRRRPPRSRGARREVSR